MYNESMVEEELIKKIEEQAKKLDEIHASMKKLQSYFKWTLILTVVFLILPLIGLAFVIPAYLKTLNFSSLGL